MSVRVPKYWKTQIENPLPHFDHCYLNSSGSQFRRANDDQTLWWRYLSMNVPQLLLQQSPALRKSSLKSYTNFTPQYLSLKAVSKSPTTSKWYAEYEVYVKLTMTCSVIWMRLMERGKCQGTRSYTVGVVEIENKPADRVGKATRVGQCAWMSCAEVRMASERQWNGRSIQILTM